MVKPRCLLMLILTAGCGQQSEPTANQIALGKTVYADNCAACHGVNLEGQPNWQQRMPNGRLPAPPHDATGHTWEHSNEMLFEVTKYGLAAKAGAKYQTDMPAFKDRLSDKEIRAVIAYIVSTWPQRLQDKRKGPPAKG